MACSVCGDTNSPETPCGNPKCPAKRQEFAPSNPPPNYDEHELNVFKNRTHLLVVKYQGGGIRSRIVEEYGRDEFEKAMESVLTYKGPYGRGATLHAVGGPPGWFSITLDKKDWPHWLKVFEMEKK